MPDQLSDPSDALLLGALQGVLASARTNGDSRNPLNVVSEALAGLTGGGSRTAARATITAADRDAWLRRVRSAQRSDSTLRAYRNAIDDILDWARRTRRGEELFEESAIVDYFDEYRRRCSPAPATYHRRFLLIRNFMRWLCRRDGLPDPFAELQAPPKPRQEADWLTPQEFAALLEAAGRPPRNRAGLAARDRLVLIGLVTTALRRSELIAIDWADVGLDGDRSSVLVRKGKGGKPRRQPLAPALVAELTVWRGLQDPLPGDPVFCGLAGGRLQPTVLAGIISRARRRAGLTKHVTAHTLRHTAATWLRQQTGDARLVAEYLGHADLSTVSRYAHVASSELHAAAALIGERAIPAGRAPKRFERRMAPRLSSSGCCRERASVRSSRFTGSMLTTAFSILAAIALLMPGFIIAELSAARSARSSRSDLELALRSVTYALVVHLAFSFWTVDLVDRVGGVDEWSDHWKAIAVYSAIVLLVAPVILGLLLNSYLARAELGDGPPSRIAAAFGAGEARDAFDYAFQRRRDTGTWVIVEMTGHTAQEPRLIGGMLGRRSAIGQTPSPHDIFLEALCTVAENADGVRSLAARVEPPQGVYVPASQIARVDLLDPAPGPDQVGVAAAEPGTIQS